jgi:hypothetical protein
MEDFSLTSARARILMQATAAFALWMKVFYFLRLFRPTAYFVNMFTKIVSVSAAFFFIYMLFLLAFGTAYLICSSGEFGITYSYMLGLGEFETEFDNYLVDNFMMITFVIATIVV